MQFLSLPFDDFQVIWPQTQTDEGAPEPGVPSIHFLRRGRIIVTTSFHPNRTILAPNWYDGERFRIHFHRRRMPEVLKLVEAGKILSMEDLFRLQSGSRTCTLQPRSHRLYWGPAAGRHAIP